MRWLAERANGLAQEEGDQYTQQTCQSAELGAIAHGKRVVSEGGTAKQKQRLIVFIYECSLMPGTDAVSNTPENWQTNLFLDSKNEVHNT